MYYSIGPWALPVVCSCSFSLISNSLCALCRCVRCEIIWQKSKNKITELWLAAKISKLPIFCRNLASVAPRHFNSRQLVKQTQIATFCQTKIFIFAISLCPLFKVRLGVKSWHPSSIRTRDLSIVSLLLSLGD